MKKAISLLLAAAMILSLAACGGGGQADQSPEDSAPVSTPAGDTQTPQPEDGGGEDGEDAGIEVDSGLLNVTITVPASFLGKEDFSQEDVDQAVKDNGYKSGTLNEDGSVTYVMSKGRHNEMMAQLRESIDANLVELGDSDVYPGIVSIKGNKDYTQYTVTLSTDEVSAEMAILPLGLYIFTGMYHAFNGTEVDNVNIQFVNEAGEVLEESNSSDMGSEE